MLMTGEGIVYSWHRPPARRPIRVLLHALFFASFSRFFIHEKRTVPTLKIKSIQNHTKSSTALHVWCATLDFLSWLDKITVRDYTRQPYYSYIKNCCHTEVILFAATRSIFAAPHLIFWVKFSNMGKVGINSICKPDGPDSHSSYGVLSAFVFTFKCCQL